MAETYRKAHAMRRQVIIKVIIKILLKSGGREDDRCGQVEVLTVQLEHCRLLEIRK